MYFVDLALRAGSGGLEYAQRRARHIPHLTALRSGLEIVATVALRHCNTAALPFGDIQSGQRVEPPTQSRVGVSTSPWWAARPFFNCEATALLIGVPSTAWSLSRGHGQAAGFVASAGSRLPANFVIRYDPRY